MLRCIMTKTEMKTLDTGMSCFEVEIGRNRGRSIGIPDASSIKRPDIGVSGMV